MRTKYKQWAVDYLNEHKEITIEKIDLNQPFFKKDLCIEVGSGKGDFILNFSSKNLTKSFIAIERVDTVAGMMAKKLIEAESKNVLIFPHDAKLIFDQIGENKVDTIFLNFVDPWPKKKHAKRRLTFHTFLESYYHILKPGGLLIFKSDNDGLYDFTLEEIQTTKFAMISNEPDYSFDESQDAMTEYERKFRDLGQPIHRIVLKK
ncbi:MAG: tRNA (guanosine(46)-N7)-methyltransferase TrmB [Bacilli bacterium]|nr:tRNA (guanosine(46)-N7)-methyltransferase TrmB [Bacilli bacterium]